jgi:hypothetical protein
MIFCIGLLKFCIIRSNIFHIRSQPNVAPHGDTDMSDSSKKTPAKRVASKNLPIDQTNLDAQFSSTRGGKLIKKEKP